MKKPTHKEIIDAIFNGKEHVLITYRVAFQRGVEWLLNWQKSQPITVYCVHSSESDIIGVFRSEEKAKERICELRKCHNVDFWIEPNEI